MNTPCDDMQSLFNRFLDGSLTRREKSCLKNHLKMCPSCRFDLQREQEIIDSLKTLPVLKCPDKVSRRIKDLIFGEESRISLQERLFMFAGNHHWKTLSFGFVVISIIAIVVLNPFVNKETAVPIQYSQEEALKARDQAKWTLAYISDTMRETKKDVLEDVILKELPKSVRKTLRNSVPLFRGGQK